VKDQYKLKPKRTIYEEDEEGEEGEEVEDHSEHL
jgi:hypothetical protein